jgi:hypothetical protein|tara:strand:+ start:4897 stop:5169 length:273 start_codon:yes stop_codon:yes gene_type:complete
MKKTLYRIANYFLNKQWVLHIVMRFLSVEKQEKILIEQLRAHLAFFGYDTSKMTDEEVKQGVVSSSELISKTGLTVDECANAFRTLGNCA